MNRVLRSPLRKMLSMHAGTTWSDWLYDCVWAMRTLVSRGHGFAPYRLVYKQEPVFPPWLQQAEASLELPIDIDVATEEEMLDKLEHIMATTITAAR